MSNNRMALDSIDKILDVIWQEEGRLAIINRYGAFLSDEEKVQATQLITSQKANMDRLFGIYRDELLPLMEDISKNSEAMESLFNKLLTSTMIAKEMNGETDVAPNSTIMEAVETEGVSMENGTTLVNNYDQNNGDVSASEAVVNETSTADASFIPASATEDTVVSENEVTENNSFVTGVSGDSEAAFVGDNTVTGESQFNLSDVAVQSDENVSGTATFITDAPATIEVSSESSLDSSVGVTGDVSGSETTEGSEVAPTDMEQESALPFILSPIDEGVRPAVSEVDTKQAEETTTADSQQLDSSEGVKADLMASTEITEEEKTEKLQQYIRRSEGEVKAILVTKAQCEKLSLSRDRQKALLNQSTEAVASDVIASTGDVVAPLPDFSAGSESVVALPSEENGAVPEEKSEDSAVVLPSIGGDTPVVEESTTDDKAAENVNDGLVLPMIGGETSVVDVPVSLGGEASNDTSSGVILEIPGAATAETTTDAQTNSNDLQAMIERANSLYKEGNVAEAQALFEKIGAMNSGAQSAETSVLVKK